MKTITLIILLIIILTSCSESEIKKDVRMKYYELAEYYESKIKVNNIKLLDTKSVNFESLANYEIERMEIMNNSRKRLIKLFNKKDSIINANIETRKMFSKNANAEYQKKYSQGINADSSELKDNHKRKIWAELGVAEDELKILEIVKLARNKDINNSKNLVVKHKIDIIINNNRVMDTIYYFSFNDGKYSYLDENLFIKN